LLPGATVAPVENEPSQTSAAPDIDSIFRRLTEIRAALDSMTDEVNDERLTLETERARLRRQCDVLSGGKDSRRPVDSLRAELGERRLYLARLHELKIRNTGLSDGAWSKYGTRARSRASFVELNESIDNAAAAEEVRNRISEILEELRRRGESTE